MQVIPLVAVEDLPPDLHHTVKRWAAVEDGDLGATMGVTAFPKPA